MTAVADVEAIGRAILPNRSLHQARKKFGKRRVEASGVDGARQPADDFGAAVLLVAGRAIGMGGAEPLQNAGAAQEIVHQSVDHDDAAANLEPAWPVLAAGDQ